MTGLDSKILFGDIINRIDVGIIVVDKNMDIKFWNYFMETHSGKKDEDVINKKIFDIFPELPAKWIEKKIKSVFILKSFAFTSHEHRPYLFKFGHNRPITGGIDYMQQDCTFMPLFNEQGEVELTCITIYDATDASIYKKMHQEAMNSLKELSIRDGLTGLFNRRHLEEQLNIETSKYLRYGEPLSLLMFDIDYFKKINDTYGHLAGDEVLREVAMRIKDCIRDTDIIGRYGGEEFIVALTCTSKEGATEMAGRILKKVSETPIMYNNTAILVTVSIGITVADDNIKDHQMLINQADSALYQSKENGRNQATYYNTSLSEA